MRPQTLMLTIACLAATPAWAGAGLTSAGVDPTPANNQPADPTLAQVAPQGTQGTTGTSAATITPGVNSATTAQSGTASATGVSGANGTTTGAAVPPVIVTPPPPPDPATLPVSVIRPVNKAGTGPAADTGTSRAGEGPAVSPLQPRALKMPLASGSGATTPAAPPAPLASSPGLRTPATSVAPRPDAAMRAASETAPEEPGNASSSGFIFYVGVGTAATILLLSLAAFFRGGGGEAGKPRSI